MIGNIIAVLWPIALFAGILFAAFHAAVRANEMQRILELPTGQIVRVVLGSFFALPWLGIIIFHAAVLCCTVLSRTHRPGGPSLMPIAGTIFGAFAVGLFPFPFRINPLLLITLVCLPDLIYAAGCGVFELLKRRGYYRHFPAKP
jgi:hypothetical protein